MDSNLRKKYAYTNPVGLILNKERKKKQTHKIFPTDFKDKTKSSVYKDKLKKKMLEQEALKLKLKDLEQGIEDAAISCIKTEDLAPLEELRRKKTVITEQLRMLKFVTQRIESALVMAEARELFERYGQIETEVDEAKKLQLEQGAEVSRLMGEAVAVFSNIFGKAAIELSWRTPPKKFGVIPLGINEEIYFQAVEDNLGVGKTLSENLGLLKSELKKLSRVARQKNIVL